MIAAPGLSFQASIAVTDLSPSKQTRLAKSLEIDPTKRGTLNDLRSFLSPTSTIMRPSGVTMVYEVMSQVNTSLRSMHINIQSNLKINTEVLAMTQATLAKVVKTKTDLMRGIFKATEVTVPASFIVLPFNMADQRQEATQTQQEVILKKTVGFSSGSRRWAPTSWGPRNVKDSNPLAATKAALDGLTQGQPMYFFLLDEVTGVAVEDDAGIYAIKIDMAL
ncbi:Aste57867_18661 [Aphanomyces stellatus]|uniref:Aste57867_18661 protein n=1 Tax=Aphanomyces stellatus TaxID=120398 RepID=A0A485LAY1_9STRA|nr:hypothetical protein As57867_018599 [Aphanomyces stellatus]VFT95396.1 Aste57867_18661 [Aphanomyces stellatus]